MTAAIVTFRRARAATSHFIEKNVGIVPWALYFLAMLHWLRAIDLSGEWPILNVDYIQYYARALRTHIFLSESGRIWGYDPFQMGGSLSGIFHEVGTYFPSLLCHWLAPIVPINRSLLAIEIVGFASFPFFFWSAIRNLGGSRAAAGIGLTLLAILYGTFEPSTYVDLNVGLFGFQWATFVAIWQVGLFFAWTRHRRPLTFGLFTLASAVVFQIHPAALVIVGVPCVAIYALAFRSLRPRHHALVAAAVAITLAANWYWISPFLRFVDWRQEAPYFVTKGWSGLVAFFDPVKPTFFLSFVAQVTACLFAWSLIAIKRMWATDRPRAVALLAWIAWLAPVSFFGSDFPLTRTLQPGRNVLPLFLVACVLAADYIEAAGRRSPDFRRFVFLVALLIVGVSHAGFFRRPYQSPPLSNHLPDSQSRLLAYFSKTLVPGRLLLETNDWDGNPHVSDVLTLMARCHVLGGPHPGNHMKTRFSLFRGAYVSGGNFIANDPIVFNRSLKTLSSADLSRYLELYNVSHIAAFWPLSKKLLEGHPEILKKADSAGDYEIFEVIRARPNWFAAGSGELTCAYDSISIQSPSRGKLVLKFHWLETMKSDPPVDIGPEFLADDPLPFIAIDNASGADRIRIFNP